MGTTFERIKKVIAGLLEIDKDAITRETTICDLGIDFEDLVYGIETEFDINIFESQYRKLQTVKDVVMYVQNNS